MSDATKRRPIASREWRLSKRLAAVLAAQHVSPNAISVAGMIAGLLGGACFAATSHFDKYTVVFWLSGAACVQLRLIANMLDGMVAVLSDRCSPVGELYNEVPDRVSDTAIFVGLGYAAGGTAPLGFGAALAAMFTAYVRATCVTAGAPPDFRGPMAKQHRMFLVTCLTVYALFASTSTPLTSIGDYPITPVVVTLGLIIVGSVLTAVRRLIGSSLRLRGGN